MPNPTTRAEAISAKCRDCIYDPGAAGTWRQQVAACESGNCPLFDFRPCPPKRKLTSADLQNLREGAEGHGGAPIAD